MNPISHKQAIKWIHRRSDGLLTEKQISFLDEHLRSCDACRAYAAEMDALPARLQNEFHARWDAKPGPSPEIMQTVTAKARAIPVRNRISSGVKLFAGAATLVLLGVAINFVVSQLRDTSTTTGTGTETVSILPRAEDRLLVFASTQGGVSDIYTMRADGSGLINLTNDPARDGNPFWSPDGKLIAFLSERSGSPQIYLMNADGSNIIQLTSGEGSSNFDINGNSPWSPDGTRLIFGTKLPEEQYWNLYVLDIRKKTGTALTREPGTYLNPSWSPDGEHIAFLSYKSESRPLLRHLFVVDQNGDHLVELTESLRIDETGTFLWLDYHWSQDGASVFFTAGSTVSQETTFTVYQAGLDSSLTAQTRSEKSVIDWWDGTTLLEEENANTLTWLRPDGSQSALDICRSTDQATGIAYKRSHQGNLFFGANCSATGWQLYWANPDGGLTYLLSSGIPTRNDNFVGITWSPDERFLAFTAMNTDAPGVTQTLYVLDIGKAQNDPSIQPLKMEESYGPSWQPVIESKVVEEPTPIVTAPPPAQADSRLLAFPAVAEDGNLDIYTMRPDGSELTNLTNNPAYDVNPYWSPNGKQIAFESERDGLSHIYSMNADGSDVTRLTDGEARYEIGASYGMNSTPWSPDGTRLIFSLWPAGETTRTLYVMDADGENKTPLVGEPSNYYSFPSWSPNGQQIAFIADDPTNSTGGPRLHLVNADGSDPIDVGRLLPDTESLWAYNSYHWSQDGQSILFIAYRYSDEGQNQWIVYEFTLQGRQLIEHARSDEPIGDWWQGTSFLTGNADDLSSAITWLRWDGTSSALKPFETCEPVEEPQYGFTYQRSSHGNLVIAAHCPDGGWWLYWADDDGTAVTQLLDAPIVAEDFSFSNLAWSPDDRFITFNVSSGNLMELYILNVEAALHDPSTQPLKATTMGSERMFYNSSWQPIRNSSVSEAEPTPVTTPRPPSQADDRLLAFTSNTQEGFSDIFLARPDGSEPVNVTNHSGNDDNPFWSPDGTRIAFDSDRSGSPQIYLMDVDGSSVVQVTDGETVHIYLVIR